MKKDQKQTIRSMSDQELDKRLLELTKELLHDKMQLSVGKLKNVRVIKQKKRERAFIKTIQTERTLISKAGQKPTEPKTS